MKRREADGEVDYIRTFGTCSGRGEFDLTKKDSNVACPLAGKRVDLRGAMCGYVNVSLCG